MIFLAKSERVGFWCVYTESVRNPPLKRGLNMIDDRLSAIAFSDWISDMSDKQALLESCVGQAQSLAGLVEYADDSIVSKTVLDKSAGTLTLFAFDAGQRLS